MVNPNPGPPQLPLYTARDLVATGSTQQQAFQLVFGGNIFIRVDPGTGAILPGPNQSSVTIYNLGANALLIYPNIGDKFQQYAINAPVSLPAGGTMTCTSYDTSLKNPPRVWNIESNNIAPGVNVVNDINGDTVTAVARLQFSGAIVSQGDTGVAVVTISEGAGTVTEIDVQGGPFLNTAKITTAGTVANSSASLTAHGVLIGEGVSPVAATGVGINGQLFLGQTAADPGWATMSGDAVITASGSVTVSKTGGTAFAPSATIDTTNASNISSGTLGLTRLGTGYTDGQLLIGATSGGKLAAATLTQGSNITITNAGNQITIAATGGGSGSVTSVVSQAGPFLANTTITETGTIDNSVASLTPHGVVLGEGTSAIAVTAAGTDGQLLIATSSADPAFTTMSGDATITKAGAVTVAKINGATLGVTTATNANILIANGSSWVSQALSGAITISNTGSATLQSGVIGNGLAINSGTVSAINAQTLTGTAGGTLTIAPASGTTDVVITMPASGGTVTLAAAPTFQYQRAVLHVKNGATLGALAPNTGYVFPTGGGPTSFALSSAGSIDRFAILAPDTTHWAVMAADTGFTV